jgi:Putative prokaryotic signal transducing protein
MRCVAATFTTALDAELARTLLDQHDIPSRLEGDLLAGAALPLSGGVGVRLLVADEHAEQAHQLVETHEKELATQRRRADTSDERVARAYRLALVGLMLMPLLTQAISLVQVLRVPWSTLSARGRRHYVIAVLFDSLVLASAVYWLAHVL